MSRKKRNRTTIFIYELDSKINHRFDFYLGDLLIEDMIFEKLFDSYNTAQIIPKESTFVLPPEYLDSKNVKYVAEVGNEKYGLFRLKTRDGFKSDLFIPHNDSKFLYQFVFGSYMYLAADKHSSLETKKIIDWYNDCFSDNIRDVDNLYAGQINDKFMFPDSTDFIIVTNYDSNRDLGVVLKKDKISDFLVWFNARLKEFQINYIETEVFENCERTRIL